MKLSRKPLSSPGRTEKFPPPLTRFLRSNVENKSRGRSRNSPMFFRRKSNPIETQEPSSPKVTCMGQVRVRRSTKKEKKNKPSARAVSRATTTTPSKERHCKWIQKASLCHHCSCSCKAKPFTSFRAFCRKWRLCFQVGSQREVQTREVSSRFESKCESKSEAFDQENNLQDLADDDDESEHEIKIFASSSNSCSPPKNALLLMRSRSTPYRSSSLASQFWCSPLEEESISKDSDKESKIDQEEELKEIPGSIVKSADIEESRTGEDDTSNSIILTICKSVPARKTSSTTTGKLLDSEIGIWKKNKRLDFAKSSSPIKT